MSESPVTPAGRRHFLAAVVLAAAGSATAACATRTSLGAAAAPITLDEFLALSALLTGAKDLNAEHGRLYLASLTRTEARRLAAVTEGAGFRGAAPPATLEALVRTGALDTAGARRVTGTIVECW